jgi:type II secretory pathway component PulF
MPTFYYRARDANGALITGEIEAQSAEELKEGLFREGMIPLQVREVKAGAISLKSVQQYFNRVKAEELMIFTRQFYTLFKAGVSMDTILDTMIKQSSGRTLKNALIRVRADVSAGATLSQAFSRHPNIFSELYVSMLAAGEEAGVLEETLKQLSSLLLKEYEIQKNVKGATLYPKVIIVVLICAVIFLMTFVVPKFVGFYAKFGAQLPLPTRILIGVSGFVNDYWYIIVIVVVLLIIMYKRFYGTRVGRFKVDSLSLKMPVFGNLNLKVANARFGHILGALYHSGLSMPRSLEVVANVIGNLAFAIEVIKVKDEIQKGSTLSEALSHQTYFPPVMIETAAVGERAGALDEMLSTVAEHFDTEVAHTVKNLTTLLEPLLLVGIFGFVALMALAIFLPVWNLATVIRS